MARLLKILFFMFIVRPVVLVLLGLNIYNRKGLPVDGPAVIAANHNSHLDTMVLMSLYPLHSLHRVRPVAAADYFLSNRLLAWFSLNVIGIIPLTRKGFQRDPFAEANKALDSGDILIIFPEGSRGQPEVMGTIKKGLFHLLKGRGDTQVTPVLIHGLGKALPRGEALLVPFNCDIVIGQPFAVGDDAGAFLEHLGGSYDGLSRHCLTSYRLGDDE